MRIGVQNCLPGNTLHSLYFLWLLWCNFFLPQETVMKIIELFSIESETVGPILINKQNLALFICRKIPPKRKENICRHNKI